MKLRAVSLTLWLISAAIYPASTLADELIWSGCSVSKLGYMNDLAKEYEKKTGVKMLVRGGGTAVGIQEVTDGIVDIGGSCRPRTSSDSKGIEFIQVAWDALVFVVHKDNPVDNISVNTIRKIYSGEITTWKHPELKGSGSIKLLIARAALGFSGVYYSLKKLALQGKEPVITPNVEIVGTPAILEQMVEKDPYAFGATGFASARKRDVKILKINGATPTKKNIKTRRYPFKRPLFLVVRSDSSVKVKKFIDFVLSREGQRLIDEAGIPPLK